MILSLLLVAAQAGAACEGRVPTSEIYANIEAANAAFADLDIEGFRARVAEVAGDLPCVRDPVDGHLSAEVHRLLGLRAAAEDDRIRAKEAFAAARSIEPDYRFPEHVIPPGSPVLEVYTALPLDSRRTTAVPTPAEGRLHFDGRPTVARPSGWPTLLQIYDAQGAVKQTEYLLPSDPMPAYPVPIEVPPPPPPPPRPARVPLLAAAGTAVIATGAMSIAGLATTARYNDLSTPDERLPTLRRRSNALAWAAGGGLVVSVALGAAVVVTW